MSTMTRQEQRRRARRRQQRRRVRLFRRILLSLCGVLILAFVIYGRYNHTHVKRLQNQIDELEQQLDDSRSQQQKLDEKLKELEKDLKEKEKQLRRNAEAVFDDPDKPNVYLTFDDGPSKNTDSILDTLAEFNVRATFFCIARQEDENIARYQRIVNEGHTLGMHSYTHKYQTIYADLDSFKSDVERIRDFLYQVTDVRPKYYRFPGGSSNTVSKVSMKKCIRYINQSELTYFDWNAQNDDATGEKYTPKQLVSHAMARVRLAGRNVVLLLHDEKTKTATAQSLPVLIKQLKNAEYDILPITEKTPLVQHVSYDSVG